MHRALAIISILASSAASVQLASAGVNQVHVDQLPFALPRLSVGDARPGAQSVDLVDSRPEAMRHAVNAINSLVEEYRAWTQLVVQNTRASIGASISSVNSAESKRNAQNAVFSMDTQMSLRISQEVSHYKYRINRAATLAYGELFADAGDCEWIDELESYSDAAVQRLNVICSSSVSDIHRLALEAQRMLQALPY